MLLAGRNKTNFLSYSLLYQSDGVSDNIKSLNLNSNHRKKYEEKLIAADGTVLPDSYILVENWKDNMKLLPDITWADIYNCLNNSPSLYTNKNWKACKSLEVYKFFVSGHV